MSNDSQDWNFKAVLWIGLTTSVVGILYKGAIEIHNHILRPTYLFIGLYLTHFGLGTAVLIFLCVLVYFGMSGFREAITTVRDTFQNEIAKQEKIVLELRHTEDKLRANLSQVTRTLVTETEKVGQLNQAIKSLNQQIQNLEIENERLKNPVAYSLKQKSKIQKENAENLKTLIHQTHWREMK